MATYVNNLRLKEITTGDESGTWGTSTNTNLELIADAFGYSTENLASDADATITMADGTADGIRALYVKITSGVSLTATRTVTIAPNTVSKVWIIENATSGSQSITIAQGSGSSVTIATGTKAMVYSDGAGATAAVVLATPTIALASGVTGTLPVANGGTGITSFGTGVATALGNAVNTTGGNVTQSGTLTASAVLLGGGSGTAISSTTTGTGVVTAVGNAVNTTGGLVTQSGTLAANNVLLGGGSATAITSSSLLATSAAVTTGTYIKAVGFADTVTALGNTGTAINLDVTSGGVFTATLTGNATITLRYPVSSGASSFTLILTNDGTAGRTVAWAGGSFKFPGGAASLSRTTTANAIDIWVFFTPDGGTTYYGNIAMKDVKA